MAERDATEGKDRDQPRRFMVDPTKFGRDPKAKWQRLKAGTDAAEMIAAYWQHLAVCVLRAKFGRNVADDLAERLGTSRVTYLKRKVSGEYSAPFEELISWTIAAGDITLLPQLSSIDDLYPPGSVRRSR